jgi:hypothetical protein
LLEAQLPQLKQAYGISKFDYIAFIENPKRIFIPRAYSQKAYEEAKRNHKSYFNLEGISVLNQKTKEFQSIKLTFSHNALNTIETKNPEYFHKEFDFNQIQINEIQLEHLKMENPDKKIAEKALKSLTKDQTELLELDFTFEIELNEKSFYTILDMEDGNYIATDKKGKIYRLIHDHEEPAKLIADNPSDFFKIYNGNKSKLEYIIYT